MVRPFVLEVDIRDGICHITTPPCCHGKPYHILSREFPDRLEGQSCRVRSGENVGPRLLFRLQASLGLQLVTPLKLPFFVVKLNALAS
jgi:hypothetical protein